MIDKKSINSIIYERELLSRLNHPLIINLQYAFQDYNNLYLVLDLLTGGDLRYQLGHHKRQYFSEKQAKFFISCIVESLIYIHSQNIIHRDIKPENLVFDEKGYLHITDFGISKFNTKNNKNETSGTPGYMAPEVMKGKNHTGSVDYFAVGVITYELMMGKRPYIGKNRKEIKEQMMSRQIYIDIEMLPFGWSEKSADFINRLMIRKDKKRLGYYNDLEIKNHPWFSDIDFEELIKKKIKSPFCPKINHDNYDKKYCEEIEKIGNDTNYRYEEYKNNKHYKNIFNGFTFYNVDESQFQIYKKPNIKYTKNIQNKKHRILRNLKYGESKTINIDKIETKLNKINNNIFTNKKNSTIDIDNYNIKNNDKETIDDDNNEDDNLNKNEKIFKNNNIYYGLNDNNYEKDKKIIISNSHKRMSSNLIGHNYLYFLQKKKLFNLNKKNNLFQNININNSNSINNITKRKIRNTTNYYRNKRVKDEKEFLHVHANSFSNNLYVSLLNKIRKEKNINEEHYLDNKQLIENIINSNNKKYQKRTIELNKIPRIMKINSSYKSLKNYLSIENNDSLGSNNNDINDLSQKINMMKASTNFYIRNKIPHKKINKITPINLRNKKLLFNIRYNQNTTSNVKNSKNNNKTIFNSRRTHFKFKTNSFSGKSILDSSNKKQNIINMISSGEHSLEKKDLYFKKNILQNKIIFNSNKKLQKSEQMTHIYSYSSHNNKRKIDSLIKNLIEQDKSKKNTIPINIKKTNNISINTKVSNLHKKIPIPSSIGEKMFHKRVNDNINKKFVNIINNSFNSSINNSISNSSLSKIHKCNNNTSINKSIKKIEVQNNKSNIIPNSNINFPNTSISINKKKSLNIMSNKNLNNFNLVLKKLNNISKRHKKNISFGKNITYNNNKNKNLDFESNNKENKINKNNIKNNILINKLRIIEEVKNKIKFNNKLINIEKNEINEIKEDHTGNSLNNNILENKKYINYNHKNKYNLINQTLKNNNGNFSYHSYNSTTSSGGKNNIK